MASKKSIQEYIKQRGKDAFAGTYERWGRTWIYFQNRENGKFKGVIEKNRYSEEATKKYAGIKVKIKFKLKGQKKRTVIYKVYNRKQQKEIIYRLNSRNRAPENKNKFKDFGFELKSYEREAIPLNAKKKNKHKVDMLFDDVEFKDVEKIDKYEG